ncbi:PACE efflux transporter [Commensalibacter nepenthis]|uniref:PACE efflux transporter n=1 Tax=Commensalibacter nepenthis TaxID=3043872 RepID=A0ABT6Q5M1_9PROT|nr:PACE efflux transporter [Commensalibacter sp. TBRC 10068]MDI2112198.1 PACE efflux transporter [Commensalibacter sp. TBRC 10068]
MRSFWDRVRHAILFEILGLVLFIPCSVWIFHHSVTDMGVIGIFSSLAATIWNFLYNLGFDKILLFFRGYVKKSLFIRVIHTILFEVGLTLVTMPFIAWYLNISFVNALIMDVGIMVFYLVYAFFFNIAYDFIFPVKEKETVFCAE